MNKTSKLFSVLLIIPFLFLLSGCLEKAEAPTVSEEVVTADTLLDNQLYEQAATSKDLKACDKILNAARKEECKKVVNAELLTDQAIAKSDKSLCGKIQLSRYKENCETTIQAKIDTVKQEAEYKKIEQDAVTKKDASICDGIVDENTKTSCKFNIIANLAIEKNDQSLCDEIGQEDAIKICKRAFNR